MDVNSDLNVDVNAFSQAIQQSASTPNEASNAIATLMQAIPNNINFFTNNLYGLIAAIAIFAVVIILITKLGGKFNIVFSIVWAIMWFFFVIPYLRPLFGG